MSVPPTPAHSCYAYHGTGWSTPPPHPHVYHLVPTSQTQCSIQTYFIQVLQAASYCLSAPSPVCGRSDSHPPCTPPPQIAHAVPAANLLHSSTATVVLATCLPPPALHPQQTGTPVQDLTRHCLVGVATQLHALPSQTQSPSLATPSAGSYPDTAC
jgi:hypothetical protein